MKCVNISFALYYLSSSIQGEVSPSEENSPTTVKSVGADSSCTYGTHYPNRIFVGHLPGKVWQVLLHDSVPAMHLYI